MDTEELARTIVADMQDEGLLCTIQDFGRVERVVAKTNAIQEEGAWQCGAGHMFRYEPPPASPPWCAKTGCQAGDFRWIIKNEVTDRDWFPDGPLPGYHDNEYSEDWS
jgi:hypothetical protein